MSKSEIIIVLILLTWFTDGKVMQGPCPFTPPTEKPTMEYLSVLTVLPFSGINSSNIFTGNVSLFGAHGKVVFKKDSLRLDISPRIDNIYYTSSIEIRLEGDQEPDILVAVVTVIEENGEQESPCAQKSKEEIKIWTRGRLMVVYSCREDKGRATHEKAALFMVHSPESYVLQKLPEYQQAARNLSALNDIYEFIEWPTNASYAVTVSPFYCPEVPAKKKTFQFVFLGCLGLAFLLSMCLLLKKHAKDCLADWNHSRVDYMVNE